ncbi:imidazole glycerol phosphate synthase subunit HisH [Longirhabdus pacifica]|uniref:imidazole glycerol phosphate synthase subunit HisH n=1 Tax=Longirhabdus pacifica TaxID=2305227 RepID=UPI0010086BFC|nr:imidazole glycerol phosphate synthase subunit HisH [Longirhabdus pacifica]
MIAIVDYRIGNVHSVHKAVQALGYDVIITDDHQQLLNADALILPGVGAYQDVMKFLHETGMDEVIYQYVQSNKPMLGICLGMQLLCTESEEYGMQQGLNIIPGRVTRMQDKPKIPHMGWNKLQFKQNEWVQSLEEGHVYFAHSYHVEVEKEEDVLATVNYHGPITAMVNKGNVFGMQFHPEKSGTTGKDLLRHFLALTEKVIVS